MVLNSKSCSIFNQIAMVPYYVLWVLISTKITNCNIISITRLPNQDDSFDVKSQQGFLCPPNACSKYNATQQLSGISDSCLCQCSSPLSTFYTKTYGCVESKDVVEENGCSIRFKDYKHESLPVINILSTPWSLRLVNKMHGDCSKIKTSWFYLKNGTWYEGKNGILSVTLKQHWTKPDMWFLKWFSELHSNYSGIIIKVAVTCEHDNILDENDEGCLMFKSQGTFKVNQTNLNPTNIPQISTTATPKVTTQSTTKTGSSTEYQPTQTTAFTTKTQTTSTTTIPPTQTTTTAIPNKEPRKDTSTGDKKIWIAFAAGGITIFFVIVGSLIFFVLMCRQRKKQMSRAGQSSTRTENANDPLHDYEYVVYPVLNEGHPSSSSRSLDNAMYGRGPDNELIIRTPGISMESLGANSINQNRDGYHGNKRSSSAYYPRDTASLNHIVNMNNTIGNSSHEYAHLQRKQEDVIDSSGIYQPLIRPVTPEINYNKPDENQVISLEPITTNDTPDYMVLEPDDSSEQDISA